MADVLEKPYDEHGFNRFLHGSDSQIPDSVRAGNPQPQPPASRFFQSNIKPTTMWTAQRIIAAFPWDTAPKYLLRDRDSIYGAYFRQRMENMGIKEVITAPQSPWQNPFVERLIGSVRRDCLDHVIVLNESHLSRILSSYFDYYHYDRTHYGLGKDTPVERPVQPRPAKDSKVIELPRVCGLHHRYEWKEAA
jgi:hypothetical protein